jgi:DNA-directed RNA polymerase alpha subunit
LEQLRTLRTFIESEILKTEQLIGSLQEPVVIPSAFQALLDLPIPFEELSIRVQNRFRGMTIKTWSDLVQWTDTDLLKTKNFGATSLAEVKRLLSIRGLQLGMFR